MPSRRSNPATKLFHAIVVFGVAMTGGGCGDDSGTSDTGQSAGGTGGADAGAAGSGGDSGATDEDASPWW